MGYRLGVDLGTTFTAAAVDDGTGPTMLGLGNRALTVPSVAFLAADGSFLFGEAADRRAATEPARSAREFKRRIGDTVPILMAGQPFSPQSLSAKLLAWVVSVATERQGSAPDEVVVTYPANWGGYKRELLDQLVNLADVPRSQTCTEPEAAATQYAARAPLAAGDKVAVYDLGGGTFDVCVLEKQDAGFRIVGSPDGVEHLGGIDFDEAVFQHVVGMLGDRIADLDLDDPDVTTGLARLRRECVDAKEALSSDVETTIAVALPGLSTSLRMTRTELEGLITSPLRDTLDATQRALRSADLTPADLTTVVLVGGSSRIPLVSHLLQSEFGVRTAMDTHPKHDIALGAVRYQPPASGRDRPRRRSHRRPMAHPRQEDRGAEPATPAPPGTVPAPGRARLVTPAQPAEAKRTGPPIWKPPRPGGDNACGKRARRRPPTDRHPTRPHRGRRCRRTAGRRRLGVRPHPRRPMRRATATEPTPSPSVTSDTPSTPTRVFDEDVLVVSFLADEDADPELHAISTTTGEDLGPATPASGPSDAPWMSRDGVFLGYREAPPGTGTDGPWTIMVRTADGDPVPLFTREPTEGLQCWLRVAWHPSDRQVLLNCLEDPDGDGKFETSLYVGPVREDGRVDGRKLEQLLTNDDPTETSRDGSPGSALRSISYLPSGDVAVSYHGGEEPGVHVVAPDGSSRRLTSGEHDEVPVSSPTDGLLAFVRTGDLYVASVDDTAPPCPAPRQAETDDVTGAPLCNLTGDVTTAPDQSALDPAWSWDGTQLVFQIGNDETGPRTLQLIDLAEANPILSVIPEPRLMGGLAWSPR